MLQCRRTAIRSIRVVQDHERRSDAGGRGRPGRTRAAEPPRGRLRRPRGSENRRPVLAATHATSAT